MRNRADVKHGERGIALVMAIVMLMVIALIALVLMTNLNVERKLSGNDVRDSASLNIAEAGVGEALSRIRNGDITLSTANPRSVAQIFLAAAGSVPVPGTDTVGIGTKQPTGQWLTYSRPVKGPDILTVEFKTDAARSAVYKFDNTLNPSVQLGSGLPVYRITSTGIKGQNRTRVVTEVIQKPFNTIINAAFAANKGINFSGGSFICGNNHSGSTPVGTDDAASCAPYEGTLTNDKPASWSSGAINNTGASTRQGWPVVDSPNQTGFYAGPWDVMQMGQSEFFSWIGAPVSVEPNPPKGIYYLDNDGVTQNHSGSFAFQGGSGEGFLYVDGDLAVNGNFDFKGVIYVEGDVQVNGTFWLLGALIVQGNTTIKLANGNATILYSSEAIQNALAKYGGQFVTLNWRQVPLN